MSAQTALSPVSWPRMIRAVEKVRDRMLRAARALENSGVAYAIVGGNAVAAWVSTVDEAAVRNTRDVHILLRRSDLVNARAALESAGFLYRHVASLGQSEGLDLFLDGADASARDALHIVFAQEKVRDESVEPSPDVSESKSAGSFHLITLEGLIRMKLTAFRDKDRTHLRDLIEVGLLGRDWLPRLSAPLGDRLTILLNNPEG